MWEIINNVSEALSGVEAATSWWLASVSARDPREPVIIGLAVFACLTGVAGRSWLLFAATALWAIIGLQFMADVRAELRPLATLAVLLGHLALLVAATTYRRKIRRLRTEIAAVDLSRRDTQLQLDREILWRMAADEVVRSPARSAGDHSNAVPSAADAAGAHHQYPELNPKVA